MEAKGMHHEDQLSTVQRAAERVREPIYVEVTKIVEVEKIVQVAVNRQPRRRPDPKFTGGQGIFQWWASWMAGAAVAPPTIKKKTACLVYWFGLCDATALSPSIQGCRNARNFFRRTPLAEQIPSLPAHRSAC